MTNIQLQQLLAQMPPDMEVGIFKSGTLSIGSIQGVYIGNERYLPTQRKKSDVNKVVIEYKT